MRIQQRDKEYIRRLHGGEYRRSQNDTNLRINRVDDERHGAHRTRGIPLVDVLHSGDNRSDRAGDVARDYRRVVAMSGDGGLLCRTGEIVSGNRKLVLFRGAVVPESRESLEVRAAVEVHRRLGLTSLLLDLSGSNGRC